MAEKKRAWKTPAWVSEHVQRYLDNPEAAHMWDSSVAGGPGPLSTLLLITTGRRSGEPRMSPVLYQKAGEGFVVIASKGGFRDHPAWYLNLKANPNCEIRVGPERYQAVAETTDGEEREALWSMMEKFYPPFNDYQARTDRRIPVVLLRPKR